MLGPPQALMQQVRVKLRMLTPLGKLMQLVQRTVFWEPLLSNHVLCLSPHLSLAPVMGRMI